jgi:hypothetical protein
VLSCLSTRVQGVRDVPAALRRADGRRVAEVTCVVFVRFFDSREYFRLFDDRLSPATTTTTTTTTTTSEVALVQYQQHQQRHVFPHFAMSERAPSTMTHDDDVKPIDTTTTSPSTTTTTTQRDWSLIDMIDPVVPNWSPLSLALLVREHFCCCFLFANYLSSVRPP